MQKIAPAHKAFFRRIAVDHPVNAGEERFAVTLACRVRLLQFAGMALCEFDTARRIGVAGQKVEAGVSRAADAAKALIGVHRLKETCRRESVIPRMGGGADADTVGFKLLIAGELRKPELAAHQSGLGRLIAPADHFIDHFRREFFFRFELLPLDAVIGGHMRHLMREHGSKFRRIVGEREKAACDVEVATGQGERIDVRRVEDGDPVGGAGVLFVERERADDLGHHALELRIGVFAAVSLQDARVLLAGKARQAVAACYRVHRDRVGRRHEAACVGRNHLAAGQERGERQGQDSFARQGTR